MKCKTSYFNSTIFRRNLAKSWPLWGGAAFLQILINLSECYSDESYYYHAISNAKNFTLLLWFPYAIIAAILCFRYLHNHRSAQMLHAYPVTRSCHFITAVASGMAMFFIPLCISLLYTCLNHPHPETFGLQYIALQFGFCTLCYVFAFGLATLCMHLSGRSIAAAIMYGFFHFAVPFTTALFDLLFSRDSLPSILEASPFIWIEENIYAYSYSIYAYEYDYPKLVNYCHFEWAYPAAICVIGILLMVLAWVLYRRRDIEAAEDLIAQPYLRPVFRSVVAVESAMVFTIFMIGLILGNNPHYLDDTALMLILLLMGGAIGFFASEMLMRRTLRVFDKKTFVKFGIFSAALIALYLILNALP